VSGSSCCPFADGEVTTGPDGHGKAETFQQGAGSLNSLGRHPQLHGNGVMGGGDVPTGAGIRDRGVGGRDTEQGVDRDVRCGPCGLTGWCADGRLDLGEPPNPVGPYRVAGIRSGGEGWGPRRPTTI